MRASLRCRAASHQQRRSVSALRNRWPSAEHSCAHSSARALATGSSPDDVHPMKTWPKPLATRSKGIDILHNPLWNKGLSFDYEERDRLNLRGLIPPKVRGMDEQVKRAIETIRAEPDPVRANLFLQGIHNRNETLYHKLCVDYIAEIAPLIYTPTVGTVCEQFGVQFRRARGMYFSRYDIGHMASMVYNWPHDRVDVIVVTDGSRILGLGDLGVHGMGIPIGKLALYCAAGGIAPHRVLPVMLDVGTNNPKFLNDEDYIGTRYPRLEGQEYFDFVDEFMQAATGRWRDVVVQFEDFETAKAVP
jgi:malate dehydrogenase (oxaloacetate-decarboxylating)(NADP+)